MQWFDQEYRHSQVSHLTFNSMSSPVCVAHPVVGIPRHSDLGSERCWTRKGAEKQDSALRRLNLFRKMFKYMK